MALPLILVISSVVSTVAGQVILIHPTDRTVFLDDDAFFLCLTRGSSTTYWRLNGTDYNNLSIELYDDLVIGSVSTDQSEFLDLFIIARAKYNGTIIQCVIENNDGDSVVSNTATLYIQGLLSSVSDVTVMNNISFITISWSAPFSLDVTNDDPDIWYSVLIYNNIMINSIRNITETYYTFTPDYLSPCHKYIFTIIPFNGAGQGQSSENITGYDYIPDITITRVDIRAVDRSTSTVIFSVSGEVERVCDYTLHGVSNDGDDMIETLSLKNDETLKDEGNIIYTLSANKYYSVYFKIETSGGSDVIHQDNFTTFDVQDLSAVVNDDGDIIVTGELITNSHAKGCFIVLQGSHNTADIYQVLSRNKQSVSGTIIVPSSNYTMYGYDIEDNALPNSLPAVVIETNINTNNSSKSITSSSTFLESASISLSGSSEVTVDCKVANGYPEASCVLVYREYGNTMLTINDFSQSFPFPMTLNIDTPEKYTFAIFGKNGVREIEEESAFIVKFKTPFTVAQPLPSQPPSPDVDEKTKTFPTQTVSISIATTSVACIIVCVLAAVVILTVKRLKKKNAKAAAVVHSSSTSST